MKIMKNLKIASMVIVLFTTVGCKSTPPTHTTHDVIATVIESHPICRQKDRNSFGEKLVIAAIGGAIGNQIGSGSGRKWATGVGAVAAYGAAGGKSDTVECDGNGYKTFVAYRHPFTNRVVQDVMKTSRQKYSGSKMVVEYKHKIRITPTNL